MLSSSEIKKRLAALASLIAEQAAKDNDFAAALSDLFSDSRPDQEERVSISDHIPEPTVDPFVARQDRGQEGFRNWLDSQSIEQLKAIISEHRLDATGNARKWKTKEKLVELIIDRVESRAKQGGVFRRYGEPATTDGMIVGTQEEPNKAVTPSGG
jgi:hypothetical protein